MTAHGGLARLCGGLARLRGLAVRLRLRRPNGPGCLHPESMTAELADAEEELLAFLDYQLWPQQSGHVLRYAFRRREEP